LVTHAEIGVRHMGGDLLVAWGDEFDAVAHVVERVEQPDVAVPAQAEHVGHLLPDQELGDQLSAFHAWHGWNSLRWWGVVHSGMQERRFILVPRTRSSPNIGANTVANFGFKAALSLRFASVLRFRSSHQSGLQGWANFGTGT